MFAYHSEDPDSSTEIKYHEFRGAKTILLLNSLDKRNISETGWKKYTMTTKNVREKNSPRELFFNIHLVFFFFLMYEMAAQPAPPQRNNIRYQGIRGRRRRRIRVVQSTTTSITTSIPRYY